MLYQVGASHAKCLKPGTVYSAFDPLVYGLSGDGRIYALTRLFDAMIVTHDVFARPPFRTRAAGAQTRQRISEVHDCQLYHT